MTDEGIHEWLEVIELCIETNYEVVLCGMHEYEEYVRDWLHA